MGLENCQIYLDNPSATYFPGENVTGRVEFNFRSEKKVRGIEAKFLGKASTYWTEDESYTDSDGKSQTRSVSYSASEEYFNKKAYLIGGKNDDSINLQPGHHVYPIACSLPSVLPSSFEGAHGKVRYTITITLIRPWKFNQSLKAAFTVIAHLDVNLNPQLRQPATLTMEKTFFSLFSKSGKLMGYLKVPYTGFVSGQIIPLTLEIDNASSVKISCTKIKLKKVVAFYSSCKRRNSSTNTIAKVEFNLSVPKKTSQVFNGSLKIPSLPPSNLTNCSIIDINYELLVTVIPDGLHKNMYGNLPITIGTIPLINMVPMPQPQINVTNYPNDIGWIPAPPNSPPIDAALMPPPSYEECQFGAKTILDHGESENTALSSPNWAPSYPVYHFEKCLNFEQKSSVDGDNAPKK